MFTKIQWHKTFIVPILMVVLIGGLLVTTPQANAQVNREAMLAQIQQLLVLITSLQQQLLQMNGDSPATVIGRSEVSLKVGTKIQTSRQVNARSGPGVNASWVNTIDAFSRGQIVDGPRSADGFTWWLVKYDNGTQGWSIGSALWGIDVPSYTEKESEDLSVDIVSLRKVSYTYGDTLTVKWDQIGSAPKGSKACVTLVNDSDDKTFAFPPNGDSCVDVAGEEPTRSLSGKIVTTSGYRLVPGTYKLEVAIIGPSSSSGKDGGTLAKDWQTIFISGEEDEEDEEDEQQDMINDLLNQVASLYPSCEIKTDRAIYSEGDLIEISWSSLNAQYVSFVPDTSGKDTLSLPGNIRRSSGRVTVEATVLGSPRITMRAVSSSGRSADCTVVATIEDSSTSNDEFVALIASVYEGSYPNGVTHSFGYHPQGSIDVYVADNVSREGDVMLVLSSYEPVEWNITGPGAKYIQKVFVTGYYEQEVFGLSSSVPIDSKTYEGGSSDYFLTYDRGEEDELHEYLEETHNAVPIYWVTDYSLETIYFDLDKG